MKAVGIIAEYNPFHNGHKYHIEESRKLTGADCVVSVMSGNFVQRGAPAFADKFTRTECALSSGADLVIELPAIYATGSAELFASGAVSLLDGIGGISHVSFGSECKDMHILKKISDILAFESEEFCGLLKEKLATGIGMPSARQAALDVIANSPEISQAVVSPNNILAIEYLKALKRIGSAIQPVNITRKDNSYHDRALTGSISSATSVREHIENGSMDSVRSALPDESFLILRDLYQKSFPVNANDCSSILNYAITDKFNILSGFSDVGESLANKIRSEFKSGNNIYNFDNMAMSLKSRDLTYTRICRALIHILLGIDTEFMETVKYDNFPSYARILGFNKTGREFLSSAKSKSNIPIISNCSDDYNMLDDIRKKIFEYDIKATRIYNNIVYSRYKTQLKDDFRSRPLIHM